MVGDFGGMSCDSIFDVVESVQMDCFSIGYLMELTGILGLATAFCNLVRVIIEKCTSEKRTPTFRKATIMADWTQAKIAAWGRKKGYLKEKDW